MIENLRALDGDSAATQDKRKQAVLLEAFEIVGHQARFAAMAATLRRRLGDGDARGTGSKSQGRNTGTR